MGVPPKDSKNCDGEGTVDREIHKKSWKEKMFGLRFVRARPRVHGNIKVEVPIESIAKVLTGIEIC